MPHRSLSVFLFIGIILLDGCVEKLGLTLEESSRLPIVINGFISDQPGPYTIKIKQSFDVGLRNSYERPISVKQLTISDDQGIQEILSEPNQGTYQTSVNGMRGVVGRVYKLRIELFNGKIYESLPDTLTASGRMDSVYYKFETTTVTNGASNYAFGIYFNASSESGNNLRFLWKFNGTFKVDTQGMSEEPCSLDIDCEGCSICNIVSKCSGLRNIAPIRNPVPEYIRFKPCECCTCWYNIFNDEPVISDYQILQAGRFSGVKVGAIPIDDWRLQHKVYAEVSQFSLTRHSHLFFKAIRDQREGLSSLFQPPSGKIPSNFVQTSGKEEPILGIFYAASISRKTIVITKRDVPQGTYEFPPDKTPIPGPDCKKLYPNATTIKPDFWVD
ncbi:MAG: DUF4249 domain-containing protein [Cyclobacteriaceae bacterium]